MAGVNHRFLKNRSEIFFARGLDSRISIESPHEIRFCAHGIFGAFAPHQRSSRRALGPSGKSSWGRESDEGATAGSLCSPPREPLRAVASARAGGLFGQRKCLRSSKTSHPAGDQTVGETARNESALISFQATGADHFDANSLYLSRGTLVQPCGSRSKLMRKEGIGSFRLCTTGVLESRGFRFAWLGS
jgi:hypothetical protein